MAQDYTRQSSFSDGDTITASLFNDEYNQLVNAFAYSSTDATSTGHRHDGTAAQGGNIPKIGDLDFNNKIEVDSTNNRWGFYVEVSSAAVEQIRIQDGAIVPVTDNDIDLGTSSLEFKDLYIDGTANIDILSVDTSATIAGLTVSGTSTLQGDVYLGNASADTIFVPGLFQANLIPENDSLWNLGSTSLYWANAYIDAITTTGNVVVGGTLGVTGAATLSSTLAVTGASTLTGNVTATNDLSVGGNLTVTGNATISGNLTFGDADTDSITLTADVASHITPDVDDTYDLGSSTKEWRNLYIDGTANIDSLVADTADINAGTIDNTVIGGTTAAAGTFTTFTSTGIDDNATSTAITIDQFGRVDFESDINIRDGQDINIGNDNDLRIYHDNTNSFISNDTGELRITNLSDDSDIKFQSDNGSGGLATYLLLDGSTGETILYHYGTEKLATKSTGINVTGDVNSDSVTTGTFTSTGIDDNATSTAITIDSSQNTTFAGTITSGDIIISEGTPLLRIQDTDGTNQYTQLTNGNGNTYFGSRNDTADGNILIGGYGGGSFTEFARWSSAGHLTQENNLTVSGAFTSLGIDDNATSTAITIDSGGDLGVGETNPARRLHVKDTAQNIARFESTSTTRGIISLLDANTTDDSSVGIGAVADDLVLYSGNLTEGFRLDSSGVATIPSAVLTTADINGGTADGVTIGGSTAAAGTFTTFTSTGIDDNATANVVTIAGGSSGSNSVIQTLNSGSNSGFYGSSTSFGFEIGDGGVGGKTVRINNNGTAIFSHNQVQDVIDMSNASSVTVAGFTSTGIDDNATGERLTITDSGIAIGDTGTNPTPVNGTTAVHATASSGAEFIAGTNDTVISSGAFMGGYVFKNADSTGSPPHYAGMWAESADTSGNMNLYFAAGSTGYETGGADLTITQNGDLELTTQYADLTLEGEFGQARLTNGGGAAGGFTASNVYSGAGVNFKNSGAVEIYSSNDSALVGSLTIDTSGNTTVNNFTSTGIDDNATSTAITINSAENVGINEPSPDATLHLTRTNAPVIRFERDDTTIASGNGLGQLQFAHKEAGNEGVAATLRVEAGNSSGSGMFVFQTGLADTVNDCMYVNHFGFVTIDPSGGGDQITHELSVRNTASPRITIDHLDGTGTSLSSALLLRYSSTNAGTVGFTAGRDLLITNELSAGDIIYETPTEHSFTIGGTEELRITSTETSVFGTSGDIFTLVDTNLTASGSDIGNVRIAWDDSAGTRVAYLGPANSSDFFVNNQYGSVKLTSAGSTKLTTISAGINVTGSIGVNTTPSRSLHVNSGATQVTSLFESTGASSYIDFANSTTAQSRSRIGAEGTDTLVFKTEGVERLRILAGGGLTFNGDTAAANALDDYEEGTYTVRLYDNSSGGNQTSTSTTAYYTKIGRMVMVSFYALNNINTTGLTSTNPVYYNLPFAAGANGRTVGQVNHHGWEYAGASGRTAMMPQVTQNASRGYFVGNGLGYSDINVIVADITSGADDIVTFTLTYFTDS